ncbi:MAG: cellulase family glycosylhydrolase [Planctomycetota bacterium]|nr:cellulase family glycosylhydrolase [Planctomycetota bacterium]
MAMSQWSPQRAYAWYRSVAPIRGCNYLPRTAVNDTEMWQADTFDIKTIDQELTWAQAAGYNSIRVFLQYIVWQNDPRGMKDRMAKLLETAKRHGITVMFVPFDDCAFAGREPYLGKQDDPVAGVHNSGWVPSPGLKRVVDRPAWGDLAKYIKDIVSAFADDRRVLVWDLYNEPGASGMGQKSLPLVEAAFEWARDANPSQPLTVALWADFNDAMSKRMIELSDVASFHGYDNPEGAMAKIKLCAPSGRPVICTEFLHRQSGNTFAAILPIFNELDVGWYNWGLVAGRTQTYMPWGSKKGDPMPAVWQHDIFHADGKPYDAAEIELLRKPASRKEQR